MRSLITAMMLTASNVMADSSVITVTPREPCRPQIPAGRPKLSRLGTLPRARGKTGRTKAARKLARRMAREGRR